MSDLTIEVQSTKRLYTFPFKDNSLDSLALNSLDILPRQNSVQKLTFLLSALNFLFY